MKKDLLIFKDDVVIGIREEFKDEVKWGWISEYQELSEDFIREFKDDVIWKWISECQTLTEDFIKEFKDEVDWQVVSMRQELSEDFIREFKDKIDWACINRYQKLSEDFIREFKDELQWRDEISKRKLTYKEHIEPYNPCEDGVDRFLETLSKDKPFTYNELVESKCETSDIIWFIFKNNLI